MGERGSSAQWEGTRSTLLFLHTCTPNNYGGAAHCAQEHGGSSGLELAAMPWAAAVLERMVNQNLHHDVIMDFKASPARPGDGCRICVHAKQGLHSAKSVWRGLATQKGWLLPGCLLALPWLSAAQHPLAPPRTRLGSHTHPTNTHTLSLCPCLLQYWDDPADSVREQEGTLLPLWEFSSTVAKHRQVTALCWNLQYFDFFAGAVGLGALSGRGSEVLYAHMWELPACMV